MFTVRHENSGFIQIQEWNSVVIVDPNHSLWEGVVDSYTKWIDGRSDKSPEEKEEELKQFLPKCVLHKDGYGADYEVNILQEDRVYITNDNGKTVFMA